MIPEKTRGVVPVLHGFLGVSLLCRLFRWAARATICLLVNFLIGVYGSSAEGWIGLETSCAQNKRINIDNLAFAKET